MGLLVGLGYSGIDAGERILALGHVPGSGFDYLDVGVGFDCGQHHRQGSSKLRQIDGR